jgi:hypothetical protein
VDSRPPWITGSRLKRARLKHLPVLTDVAIG